MSWLKDPRNRVKAATWLLYTCTVGWPISMFTFAKNEPPTMLSLSWLALIVTCLILIATTDVREQQEES